VLVQLVSNVDAHARVGIEVSDRVQTVCQVSVLSDSGQPLNCHMHFPSQNTSDSELIGFFVRAKPKEITTLVSALRFGRVVATVDSHLCDSAYNNTWCNLSQPAV
jgi:hypothetical protein